MGSFRFPRMGQDRQDPEGPSPSANRGGGIATLVGLTLALLIIYAGYFWFVRRTVVGPGQVLVLIKKNGDQSLSTDQVIVPRAPADAAGRAAWEEKYGNTNGVLETVFTEGVYFYSPFDYEREVYRAVTVEGNKVGIVVKKFGEPLDPNQVMADPDRNQRGPLPVVLRPGRYNEYSNPYAYEVKQVDPVQVDPGERGVVTVLAGTMSTNPNTYLVENGAQGVQKDTEPEGFRYINPFAKRITPVSIQSQRFEMAGADAITFPSSDSFEIKMEGFVEWSVIPGKLPLIYTEYAEGGELLKFLDEKVILPYARSYSRLVGSQYNARDFISGDTKLKFQQEFEHNLRAKCAEQGIEILQALVRDIVPPNEIKNPINEREIAKQQILSLQQQIEVARSQANLARQTELATQNQKIGEANKQVVTIVKKAEQERDVAITKTRQDLAVAQLRLEAAQKQADAMLARGTVDANIILLNKQAEAQPLQQQISAFGNGDAYAQYFFFQKVAPAIKSILADTNGPFADMFQQLMHQTPKPAGANPAAAAPAAPVSQLP